MERLFTRTEAPAQHRRDQLPASWFTWSPDFIRLIQKNFDGIQALPNPRYISVRGCDPYSDSYSYRLSALREPLVEFAVETGEALLRARPGNSVRLFCRMLDPPMSSAFLHKCFALVRAGVARCQHDPRSALYAPVKTERIDDGFPLHFDLFLTERLWLIFDNVPHGNSGKSLFLSRSLFEATIKANDLIPPKNKRKLRGFPRNQPLRDSFDECFSMIYDSENPWATSLARAMKQNSRAIKFRRGEGYLINDRNWLHGRTAVAGRIPTDRFRRLIYGSC